MANSNLPCPIILPYDRVYAQENGINVWLVAAFRQGYELDNNTIFDKIEDYDVLPEYRKSVSESKRKALVNSIIAGDKMTTTNALNYLIQEYTYDEIHKFGDFLYSAIEEGITIILDAIEKGNPVGPIGVACMEYKEKYGFTPTRSQILNKFGIQDLALLGINVLKLKIRKTVANNDINSVPDIVKKLAQVVYKENITLSNLMFLIKDNIYKAEGIKIGKTPIYNVTLDDNSSSWGMSINLEESTKEHWLIEHDKEDPIKSLTQRVRSLTFRTPLFIHKNGKTVQARNEIGGLVFDDPTKVHNKFLDSFVHCTNAQDYLNILNHLAKTDPQLNWLKEQIQNDSRLFDQIVTSYNHNRIRYNSIKAVMNKGFSYVTNFLLGNFGSKFKLSSYKYKINNNLKDLSESIYTFTDSGKAFIDKERYAKFADELFNSDILDVSYDEVLKTWNIKFKSTIGEASKYNAFLAKDLVTTFGKWLALDLTATEINYISSSVSLFNNFITNVANIANYDFKDVPEYHKEYEFSNFITSKKAGKIGKHDNNIGLAMYNMLDKIHKHLSSYNSKSVRAGDSQYMNSISPSKLSSMIDMYRFAKRLIEIILAENNGVLDANSEARKDIDAILDEYIRKPIEKKYLGSPEYAYYYDSIPVPTETGDIAKDIRNKDNYRKSTYVIYNPWLYMLYNVNMSDENSGDWENSIFNPNSMFNSIEVLRTLTYGNDYSSIEAEDVIKEQWLLSALSNYMNGDNTGNNPLARYTLFTMGDSGNIKTIVAPKFKNETIQVLKQDILSTNDSNNYNSKVEDGKITLKSGDPSAIVIEKVFKNGVTEGTKLHLSFMASGKEPKGNVTITINDKEYTYPSFKAGINSFDIIMPTTIKSDTKIKIKFSRDANSSFGTEISNIGLFSPNFLVEQFVNVALQEIERMKLQNNIVKDYSGVDVKTVTRMAAKNNDDKLRFTLFPFLNNVKLKVTEDNTTRDILFVDLYRELKSYDDLANLLYNIFNGGKCSVLINGNRVTVDCGEVGVLETYFENSFWNKIKNYDQFKIDDPEDVEVFPALSGNKKHQAFPKGAEFNVFPRDIENDPNARQLESRNDLREFFLNSILANASFFQFVNYTPDLFRDATEHQKREKAINTPGTSADIDATDVDGKKFSETGIERVVYFKEITKGLEKLDEVAWNRLKAIYPTENVDTETKITNQRILSNYKRIKTTDGQGYRTLKSLRKVLGMTKKWTDEQEIAYKRINFLRKNAKDNNRNLNINELDEIRQLAVVFQPVKPHLSSHEKVYQEKLQHSKLTYVEYGEDGTPNIINPKDGDYMLIGVEHKYAEVPLIPEICEKGSFRRDIAEFMEENDIDLMCSEECVKAGNWGAYNIEVDGLRNSKNQIRKLKDLDKVNVEDNDAFNGIVHEFDYSDYTIQVETPVHLAAAQLFGTQIRKHVLDALLQPSATAEENVYKLLDALTGQGITKVRLKSINNNGQPVNLTRSTAVTFYNELICSVMMHTIEDTLDGIKDPETLSSLLSTLKSNDVNSVYEDHLKYAITTKDGVVDFKYPLSEGFGLYDLESSLTSIFRSNINKQKINGGSAIQVSDFGLFEEGGEYAVNKRRLRAHFDENGNIDRMECAMAWDLSYIDSQGNKVELNFSDYCLDDGTLIAAESIDPNNPISCLWEWVEVEEHGKKVKKKKYRDEPLESKLEKEFPGITDLVAYRIPTERDYSIFNLRVVKFFPKFAGGVIALPAMCQAAAGFDFDIKIIGVIKLC